MVSVSYNGATVAYYRPRATIPAFSLIKKKSKAFSLRSVLIWFTRTYHEVYTNYLQHTYIPLPLCVCAAGSLLLRYTWRHLRCCILRSRFIYFFSWPLSTSAVNTNKYVRIWAHTTNAYKLSQTFRRPERLTCDLIQLRRSVKQAVCDEETFFSQVMSRDTR